MEAADPILMPDCLQSVRCAFRTDGPQFWPLLVQVPDLEFRQRSDGDSRTTARML